MKKNKMMRLASFLLVATLLTTSMISGTFAKYVTSETGGDHARVAHFGVEIIANGDTFANAYAKDDEVTAFAQTVVGKEGADVVAPGTTGNFVPMTLKGIPEVAVRVDYDATVKLENWLLADGTEYCPIYFTVDGKTYGTNDTNLEFDNEYATVAALVEGVQGAINAYSAEYAPHTDLAVESTVKTPDITWTWAFNNGDDTKDTWLGNAAAAGNYATIDLAVETTVTQID